jgi:hypothetical protein
MNPPFRASPESYLMRAKKVSALKKAVQEGTYEIDSTKVANILIIHLLKHSTGSHRPSLNGSSNISKLPTVH